MIAAPPAALAASPARIELAGGASRTIRIVNPGGTTAVVEANPAGFGLDLRGRPHVVGRRDPAVTIVVRPRSAALPPGGAATFAVSAVIGRRAQPGDHPRLVLLATAAPRGGGVAVRVRLGVVVIVRVPGALVHRLGVHSVRLHRRVLAVALRNRGNVVERFALRVVLRRRGRAVAAMRAPSRELLPGSKGVVELRVPARIRGRVSAVVELWGRAVARRAFVVR